MANIKNAGFTNAEEMEVFIFNQVQKASKKFAIGTRHDSSDLESYLMIRVWNFITKNPKYQTPKGVNQAIKSRATNFFNSSENSEDLTFSALSSQDDEGSETDFESTFDTQSPSIDSTVVESELLNGFLNTLSLKQRQVVELRAGILDSLSAEQLTIAKAIITAKQAKESWSGAVFTNTDIAGIINGSMKPTPTQRKNLQQKTLPSIVEKALDFGLEDLV